MGRNFKAVAVGGTFDSLHKGHKALLLKAFEVGEHVLIGLCSDEFAKTLNKSHPTASYAQRLKELKAFLNQADLLARAEIVSLNDAYGPALLSESIEALVVSKETESTTVTLNRKRKTIGLPPLRIVVVDLVPARDGLPISTTRIRRGEVNKEGSLLKSCSK
jgi:pantetheine-phosphate adenylyltransferase